MTKLYSIAVLPYNRVAVTCETEGHKQSLRIYHIGGDSALRSIETEASGNPYFSKPAYMIASGTSCQTQLVETGVLLKICIYSRVFPNLRECR